MTEWVTLIVNLFFLVIGFTLLIKGADFFVDGASKIALKSGIPQIVIGLTVVAFGTSAPEAAVSLSAAFRGSTGIAIGNILGSNIMNILLILGLSACVMPLPVRKSSLNFDIPFVALISVVLAAIGFISGKLDLTAGLILWVFFIVFFVRQIMVVKAGKSSGEEVPVLTEKDTFFRIVLITIAGLAGIIIGSNMTVDGATAIAQAFGVSDRVIGLTVIAFGTSLPELLTSVTAARKGNPDIAVGNIVGSNIFNILFVLGTTALICPVPYGPEFYVDSIVCILASFFLWFAVFRKGVLGRYAGVGMLIFYGIYFVYMLASPVIGQ
ncbi:calcium/sodium antiporter [Methanosarcinaceae archaeon]|nr:calcium/sodium antiporter [Methanosarcinaceae archaeon]